MDNIKTSEFWMTTPEFKKTKLLDPDGWDRKNFQFSFYEELITKEEFSKRLMVSTCMFKENK